MSLNNKQMLPARVRKMRQMEDILNAEDIILAELEKVIDEIYQSALLLHEELVNEKWLERHIQKITGGVVEAAKVRDALLVEIVINRGLFLDINTEIVIAFLDKWLPAHLKYNIIYEKVLSAVNYYAIVWQDDEIMTLRQVIV